jgi:hypothetical protein
MRRWFLGVWLGSMLSSGCAARGYDRASYELGSVAGVLFSNSLVIAGKVLPQRTGAAFALSYPLLFQNQSNATASLGLAEAVATLNGEPAQVVVRCSEHGYLPSASLTLQPGERLRVDCQLSLTASGLRMAQSGDSEILLQVPVLSEGRLLSAAFAYRVELEDAS